ncbi:MAG: type I secretion system permease/ATPase [Hoeflea sp.]|nr:type I secretion system permease/ATPase [Hoeflea sp.]
MINQFKSALSVYRSIIVSILLFSAVINILMFVSPLYMLQLYDRVLHSRSEMTLIMLTLIAVGLLITYAVLEWVRSRVLVRAGLRFDDMISDGLFTRVITQTMQSPQSRSEFALSDIDRLREFLTGQGLIAICDLPWIPVFLAVCFYFHPIIGWIAVIGAAIIFALAIANEVMTKNLLNEASGYSQSATHFSNTTLRNVEVIRALGMENSLRSRWSIFHRDALETQALASDRAGVLLSTSKFVRMTLQILILGAGGYLAITNQISPGAIVAASIMMGRALQPVDQVVGQWKQFVGARAAYGRLKKMFDDVPGEVDRLELPKPSGRISVEQLAVVAPGTRTPLLQGVTFSLEPGEVLAVIGPSGAGKSSLIRSMVGVWPIVSGAIRLDGAELSHWKQNDLGAHLGYLPQDVELFAGSIAENISRFRDEVTPAEIIEAATISGVHQMIQALPDGYETQIGVGGGQLSGGQRQRVGLARAIFGKPSFVILDEPNANLDSEGEEALAKTVLELKAHGVSVVFVTHKISLVAVSDKVLILNAGKMQAFGPTKELLQPTQVTPPAGSVQVNQSENGPAKKAQG